MKRFACGDVIPDCDAEFLGSEAEILAEVADHARTRHGITVITDELVNTVRNRMREA